MKTIEELATEDNRIKLSANDEVKLTAVIASGVFADPKYIWADSPGRVA
jgi:hypothetical protein